jgi:hypothetical protein
LEVLSVPIAARGAGDKCSGIARVIIFELRQIAELGCDEPEFLGV